MRHVTLVIRDLQREMQAVRDEHFARCAAAALAAEPETIAELDRAMDRYLVPSVRGERRSFEGFLTGAGGERSDEEPRSEGVLILDLPGRLVVSDFLFAEEDAGQPAEAGGDRPDEAPHEPLADVFDDAMDTSSNEADQGDSFVADYPETYADTPVRLSGDWIESDHVTSWRELAETRRRERAASPPLDARAILYGRPLVEFIARQCWEAFRGRPAPRRVDADDEASDAVSWRLLPEEEEESNLVRQIHIRWILTSRDDLRGQSPRDVMLRRHDAISWDLHDRSMQWSHEGRCPRGLDTETAAYRFAGFGTHELVTYYDLVRHLLWSCRDAVAEQGETVAATALTAGDFAAAKCEWLQELRDEWLDLPNPEFQGARRGASSSTSGPAFPRAAAGPTR